MDQVTITQRRIFVSSKKIILAGILRFDWKTSLNPVMLESNFFIYL